MPSWMALSFQDSTSSIMEQLTFFHDHTMIILVLITIMTLHLMWSSAYSKYFNKFMMEGQEIETIWTILPGLLLLFIAMPSMKALYLMEDTKSPSVTLKTNGHQWYWSYEYTSVSSSEVESFMEESKNFRLLKSSQNIFIPVKTSIRALITSSDVIHAWTVPSMGVKVDALPGRLNQVFLSSKRLGLFFGQCSEICGANHSFMPITIQAVGVSEFIKEMKKN